MYQITVREPYGPELEVVEVDVEDCQEVDLIQLVVWVRKPGR